MSVKYICDICEKETDKESLKTFENSQKLYDLCPRCITRIITNVFKNELMNLKPWCKKCNGEGYVKEPLYGCEQAGFRSTRCEECIL